jgi:hypothetical protein
MTSLVSALLPCGLRDLAVFFFLTPMLKDQGSEYGLTLWSISETFVIIFTGCLPTLNPLWDCILPKQRSNPCSGTDPSRNLSNTYFAQQQAYQMFSMASTTKNSLFFRENMHGEGSQREIRATTQIDVSSQSV